VSRKAKTERVRIRVYAPKGFPKHPKLKEVIKNVEEYPGSGRAIDKIKANIRAIIYDICAGLSADKIAIKYDVGERSLWRMLSDRLGYTKKQIEAWCKEEETFKKMEKEAKLEEEVTRKKIVPADTETLKLVLDFWRELEPRLSEGTQAHYLKVWLELCQFANKHPDDITEKDIKEFLQAKQLEWKEELKKDITDEHVKRLFSNYYIVPLRVFCHYKGLKITPVLKTIEYVSPYRSVRISVEQRFKILNYVMEKSKDPEYDKGILFLLYYQGHRATELTTIKYEVREHYIITYTKGKKGIRYQKLLPRYVYPEVEEVLDNPPSEYRIKQLKEILYEAYEKYLPKGSVTYYYAVKIPRPIHVWRHTACNDLIDYTDYNLSVIMEVLGWRNPKMIIQVYGEATPDMIARSMGWIIAPKNPFDFLYNEIQVVDGVQEKAGRVWLDIAYDKGYISEEYYEGVKRNQERLIKEFLRRRGL